MKCNCNKQTERVRETKNKKEKNKKRVMHRTISSKAEKMPTVDRELVEEMSALEWFDFFNKNVKIFFEILSN